MKNPGLNTINVHTHMERHNIKICPMENNNFILNRKCQIPNETGRLNVHKIDKFI